MKRLAAVIAMTTLWLAGAASSPRTAAQVPTVAQGLTAYAAGDFQRALEPVKTLADLNAVHRALSEQTTQWTGSDESAQRQRLVAAAFALEAALKPIKSEDSKQLAARRRELIGWGGTTIATGDRPQRGEHGWFLAAIAALESLDWYGLIELSGNVASGWNAPKLTTRPLIALALERFPGDARFLLAQAVVEARFGWPIAVAAGQPLRDDPPDPSVEDPHSQLNRTSQQLHALLMDARKHFEKVTTSSEVGAEAHLRAGHIQLVVAERGGARKHFRDAELKSTDIHIRYLSRLFAGWTWDRDRKTAEAEAAYRSALTVLPRARAASTLLAALLVSTNRPGDAVSLMDNALVNAGVGDPLEDFMRADATLLADRIARLRAAIR